MALNKNNEPLYVMGNKYSYNALKNMTKDELIDLLRIAQHNYECVNESLFNITQHAEKLDKALDVVCELLSEFGCSPIHMCGKDISCKESCTNNPKKCWREYLMKGDKE